MIIKNIFIIFVIPYCKKMATILLKKLDEDLHRDIKRLQLDYEEHGEKKSLEEIYIELIKKGLDFIKKQNPTK
jgi:hypothetical protein